MLVGRASAVSGCGTLTLNGYSYSLYSTRDCNTVFYSDATSQWQRQGLASTADLYQFKILHGTRKYNTCPMYLSFSLAASFTTSYLYQDKQLPPQLSVFGDN